MPEISAVRAKRQLSLPLSNPTSFEILIPPLDYVTAVRNVLRIIDFDPCSSEFAQRRIEALRWVNHDDHQAALSTEWRGNVFLHPHPKTRIARQQIQKLMVEYLARRVKSAIMLFQRIDFVRAEPLLQSFPWLMHYVRMTQQRINEASGELIPFYPSSNTVTLYLPESDGTHFDDAALDRFVLAFGRYGRILLSEDLGQDWQSSALVASRRMMMKPLLTETRIRRHLEEGR